MKNNKKVRYGMFYKSHGKWTGPYLNRTLTEREVNTFKNDGTFTDTARFLKSRVSVRKLK